MFVISLYFILQSMSSQFEIEGERKEKKKEENMKAKEKSKLTSRQNLIHEK